MGMCHNRLQNKKYSASKNATLKRLCLEAERLKRWRADGLPCKVSSINSRSVCVNASESLTGSDEESTTYEGSWALPRYRLRAGGLYLSWRNDR